MLAPVQGMFNRKLSAVFAANRNTIGFAKKAPPGGTVT